MSDPESQIIVQVAAIYNWTEDTQNCNLILEISSLISPSQIMTKKVEGRVSNAKLLLNTTLKITYTTDQKQIKLKIYKNENNKNDASMQFLLDLEILKEKNVQFLPFRSNEKVLKVITRSDSQENGKNVLSKMSFRNNKKFINEKQEFLQKLSIKSNFNRKNKKRQFCELIYQLLQQVRSIKQVQIQKKYLIYSNQMSLNKRQQIQIQSQNKLNGNEFSDNILSGEPVIESNGKIELKNIRANNNNKVKQKIHLPTNRLTLRDLKIVPNKYRNANYFQDQGPSEIQFIQNKQPYYSLLKNTKN